MVVAAVVARRALVHVEAVFAAGLLEALESLDDSQARNPASHRLAGARVRADRVGALRVRSLAHARREALVDVCGR